MSDLQDALSMFEDGISGLHRVVERLSQKTATGRGGLGPLVPYEKLHRELSDYTDSLGLIFDGFHKRLKALEQKAQVQHR